MFTLDQIDRNGRTTTSSTILYLGGKAREFEGFGCSGTQFSRLMQNGVVEIVCACSSGDWTRFVRRMS